MKSIQLISNLFTFYSFAKALERNFNEQSSTEQWQINIKSQFLFITLEVSRKSAATKELAIKIQYILKENKATLYSLYCHGNINEQEIRTFIGEEKMETLNWDIDPTPISTIEAATVRYLSIADSIAEITYNLSSGDNYEPSYYSEVNLSENEITLLQSNHHNARSINHKNDYYLRDLKIRIPLAEKLLTPVYGDEPFGKLLIQFNDCSSPNNKSQGMLLAKKIQEHKKLLEQ